MGDDKILIVAPETNDKLLSIEDLFRDAIKQNAHPINNSEIKIDIEATIKTVSEIWYSSVYGETIKMQEIKLMATNHRIPVVEKWKLDSDGAFKEAHEFVCKHLKKPDDIKDIDEYWDVVAADLNDSEKGGIVNPLRIKLLTSSINYLEAVVKKEIETNVNNSEIYIEREFASALRAFRVYYYLRQERPNIDKIKKKKLTLCDFLSEGAILFLNECEWEKPQENKKTA